MIDRCCPTLSRGLLKREFVNTAAAFGVLVLLGFAVSMLRPALAQGVLERFTAQLIVHSMYTAALTELRR